MLYIRMEGLVLLAPNPDYCVSDSHPLAYEKIRTYMAWRCWASARRLCVFTTPSCARCPLKKIRIFKSNWIQWIVQKFILFNLTIGIIVFELDRTSPHKTLLNV